MSEIPVTDPKTDEVKTPQTLRNLLSELAADELDSTQFVLCIGIGSRIATMWNGSKGNLMQLASHAKVTLSAAFDDEDEAMSLKKEGRLN